MTEDVNKARRNLLIGTSVVGAVGIGFAAVPFLKSWLPSERAKAAGGPVKADFSKVEIGQMIKVMWRGQPVFIVNRTKEQRAVLESENPRLKDPADKNSIQPDYIKDINRSRKDYLFVVIGICTHLGCVPRYVPELMPQQFDSEWQGGFYCPCHNSRFDIAGRVYKGSPAGRNLDIPPYMFLDDNTLIIGVDKEEA
ncbi:MAG: ubiquinol-cytochrome c reductase iron-sulfur subunit [Proteobacteria bacterium]|nr:ubiquinol-cytochrome c reductase iron-sulfur subunit [Pseudomonadota bacterium]